MDAVVKKEVRTGFRSIWSGMITGHTKSECVVPDSMPDIAKIIGASAIVSIRSKSCDPGGIRISTDLDVKVMYMPEGGMTPCCISLRMECDVNADAADVDTDCRMMTTLWPKNLEAVAPNCRKVQVTAELTGRADCFRKQAHEIVSDIEYSGDEIQVLKKECSIVSFADYTEKTFVHTCNIPIPAELESVPDVYVQSIDILVNETEYSGGKLIFRGRAVVNLLLPKGEELLPVGYDSDFSQIMDTEGDCSMPPEICCLLTGAYFDPPESNGNYISAELHILAQCLSMQQEKQVYVADAYSVCRNIVPQFKKESLISDISLRELTLPLAGETAFHTEICDVISCQCMITSIKQSTDEITVSASAKILFRNSDGSLGTKSVHISGKESIDTVDNGRSYITNARIRKCSADYRDDKLSVQAEFCAEIRSLEIQNIAQVFAIEQGPENTSATASATLRRKGRNDDLWLLAKDYGSKQEIIQAVNEAKKSEFLLIPKAR